MAPCFEDQLPTQYRIAAPTATHACMAATARAATWPAAVLPPSGTGNTNTALPCALQAGSSQVPQTHTCPVPDAALVRAQAVPLNRLCMLSCSEDVACVSEDVADVVEDHPEQDVGQDGCR